MTLKDGIYQKEFEGINRVEYIDQTGRAMVRYLNDNERIEISIQDSGRTLKVFQVEVNNGSEI